MSKTKTIRITIEDAKIVEQAVRNIAAEEQQEVKVSQFLKELVKHVPQAKKDFKAKINKTS